MEERRGVRRGERGKQLLQCSASLPARLIWTEGRLMFPSCFVIFYAPRGAPAHTRTQRELTAMRCYVYNFNTTVPLMFKSNTPIRLTSESEPVLS